MKKPLTEERVTLVNRSLQHMLKDADPEQRTLIFNMMQMNANLLKLVQSTEKPKPDHAQQDNPVLSVKFPVDIIRTKKSNIDLTQLP